MSHSGPYHFPGHTFDCSGCQDGPCVCSSDDMGCASMVCRMDSVPVELPFEAPDYWTDLGHA